MFRCPACSARSISLFEKFFATGNAPARCAGCGARVCLAQDSKGRLVASIVVLALVIPAAFRIKVPPHLALALLVLALVMCVPALALPLRVVEVRARTPLERWARKTLGLAVAAALLALLLFYVWNHLGPTEARP